MEFEFEQTQQLLSRDSSHPEGVRWLKRADRVAIAVGLLSTIVDHGQQSGSHPVARVLVVLAMAVITASIILRYRWSLAKPSFFRRHRVIVLSAGAWIVGIFAGFLLGPTLAETDLAVSSRWEAIVFVTKTIMVLYSLFGFVRGVREIAARGINPATVLIGSFLVLIMFGTVALMLPRSSADGTSAPFQTALFTATSASCVTGLVVVDTGVYWSRFGQCVILLLIQCGGLGIMTFGAIFAAIAGRGAGLRESATMRELLVAEGQQDLNRLVLAIIGFTLIAEVVGAVLLSGLWSHLPLGECVFQSVFHSVSGFCNAGFALTENSLVGMAGYWQIWGVMALLIIVGGMGFGTLQNLSTYCRRFIPRRSQLISRPARVKLRLHLTTRVALITTACLLVGGTILYLLIERQGESESIADRFANAWFQSVTFRTAGFNTVEIGELQPSTKLFGILLMFIGACPGSTAGGIKTTVFGVSILGLASILKGRQQVECFGRTIPFELVNRAFAVTFLAALVVMSGTLLVVLLEHRPELFLDHMFEVSSAAGTVGLSSSVTVGGETMSITKSLTPGSLWVITIIMFLGRVGPLTLLIALAGRHSSGRYEYPTERVVLG